MEWLWVGWLVSGHNLALPSYLSGGCGAPGGKKREKKQDDGSAARSTFVQT